MSVPRPDRWGRRPVPLLGGAAVMMSGTLGALLPASGRTAAIPLLTGSWAAFSLGVLDDRANLGPRAKLMGLAACYLLEDGVVWVAQRFHQLDIDTQQPIISRAVEIVLCLAGANAFNLADNMDGLAGGLASLSLAAIAGLGTGATTEKDAPGAPTPNRMAACLAGGICGFLLWNAPPARIFLGDSGSLPLGYLLVRLAWRVAGDAGPTGAPQNHSRRIARLGWQTLCVCFILAVPGLDSLHLLVDRAAHHRPLFPGNTDHLSHRLARAGLPEPAPALILHGAQALACFALLHCSGAEPVANSQDRGHAETEVSHRVVQNHPRYQILAATVGIVAGILLGRAAINRRR